MQLGPLSYTEYSEPTRRVVEAKSFVADWESVKDKHVLTGEL
jgi:hypothetical protein